MIGPKYPTYPCPEKFGQQLLSKLAGDYEIWGPCLASDGICRLQKLIAPIFQGEAGLPMLPVKKILLPPREKLWRYRDGEFEPAALPPKIAVINLALCELQAIWYLDQAFVADELYQRRRERFLFVGSPCRQNEHCRCQPQAMPISGDLFWSENTIWAISPLGRSTLEKCQVFDDKPFSSQLNWPVINGSKPKNSIENLLARSGKTSIWEIEARRCLSCGACSAVCPTCYCFDLIDEIQCGGDITRIRQWDNCFFARHGQIAGEIDFRAGRANRLRFRVEHKRLGFGELRGQNSCVGCGRCRKACPVDIDLDRIVEKLDDLEVTDGDV